MNNKSTTEKIIDLIKGTLVGKVVLALIGGGLSIIGAAPFFDKYISAALDKYLEVQLTDPSTPLGLSFIIAAVLLTVWERTNQVKLESKKIEKTLINTPRPIIDLCNRGISVRETEPLTIFFDIPYCSGMNAHAYHVKLEALVIKPINGELVRITIVDEAFPENITLTYETGKTILFSLTPLTLESAMSCYIVVKGTYRDTRDTPYKVFDVYKFNRLSKTWARTLGDEDIRVREYVQAGLLQ